MTQTTRALRALAHPVRLQMLSLLTGAELSATEVARELDITHANASYHLRRLLDAGEVVIASEETIRGGVAKRYRHPWQPAADTGQIDQIDQVDRLDQEDPPPADRLGYVQAMARELTRRARRLRVGSRAHLTDADLWVDPEAYQRVFAAIHEAALELHAAARPPRTPGTIRVNLTAALFEIDQER